MDAVGQKARMGLKMLTAWSDGWSAVDVPLPFVDETLTRNFSRIESDTKTGSGSREPSDQGDEIVKGSTKHELDYNNFDSIFELLFGSVSTRIFDVSDDHIGKYAGLEIDKQTSRWRFWPGKITKATISGEKGQKIMLELEWLFRTGVITTNAFPALTFSNLNRVLFQNLRHRIADQVDAIGAGDTLGIDSFSVEYDNKLVEDDRDSESDQQILEPIPSEFREIAYSFKVPRYSADTLQTWKAANQALQADLYFLRSSESLLLQLPELRIVEGFDAETPGAGAYTQEGKLEVRRSSNATMFTGTEIRATFT